MKKTRRATWSLRHRMRGESRLSRWRKSGVGQAEFAGIVSYAIILALFGGGLVAWSAAYAVVAAATIFVAATLAARIGHGALASLPLTGKAALIGVAILPLLQLIPLPPSVWQGLPGGELRFATLTAAGLAQTWQPLSLEPASTAMCAILAIGFVVFVAALVRLPAEQYYRLLKIVIGLMLVGVLVGLLQVITNGYPPLKVRDGGPTMLGFFANKNHMALAIASSILIFGLVVNRNQRHAMTIAYTALAIVCIVTTNSRAGLVFGGLATAVVFADLTRGVSNRWRVGALLLLLAVLAGLISTSAFEQVSSRLEDISSDGRWEIISWSWPLAKIYGLLGSGFGSFATVFAASEQLSWLGPTYTNAAHNDYIQLVIEAGIPGAVLLGLLICSIVACAKPYLSMSPKNPLRIEMLMGFSVIVLFALHSGFDYPLRRPAAWLFFALALSAIYRGHAAYTAKQVRSETVDPA